MIRQMVRALLVCFLTLTCILFSLQVHPAVRLPPGVPSTQPPAAVTPEPHIDNSHLPLPGVQLRLQPLCPIGTRAVPLRPLSVALHRLPQLQLLSRYADTHSNCSTDPSSCLPSSSGRTHCHVAHTAGLPPLPTPPARPDAVSRPERG